MRRFVFAAIGTCLGTSLISPGLAWASESSSGCTYSGGTYYNCDTANVTKSAGAEVDSGANRSAATVTTVAVSNQVSRSLSPSTRQRSALGETGVSGGDDELRYSLWGALGATSLSSTVVGAAFSGTAGSQTVGFDMVLNQNLVVGVAAFHESNTFETDFNAGRLDSNGYSLVPYVGYDFGQGTSIDGLIGLTWTDNDASRASGTAQGHYNGYRAMAAANAHHGFELAPEWRLRGDFGMIWAYSDNDSYTETGPAARQQAGSTSHLVQAKAGGRLSYLWGQIEPFAALYYAYDLVHDYVGADGTGGNRGGSDDADEAQIYAGLDWFPTDTESVGLEFNRVVGRDRTSAMGVLMNARLRF
ncbi:autotransporter outer membrane beta-barrel domain-containing protein [Magnetospirillum sp. UT-4]|uniref:autotransporter outer membrane beta-barrel domain-containing protein n=1 Tax=Magnetospirillum sp. UT-4 TaxID=2681467 RepID=UPI00137E3DC9|nr:autotransporter outer membrane beta-barrel domain-containing protein [Magnetospirillum sp. UT-4]CAA7615251.1 putative Outer membrane protein domain-containing protein [Magnetospirillum sp. UT-4]